MKTFNTKKTIWMLLAFVSFNTTNSFANDSRQMKTTVVEKPVKDTPYIARVTIVKTGTVDTPYLELRLPAENIYKQIATLLIKQEGLYRVNIVFESESGEFIREEEYYIGSK